MGFELDDFKQGDAVLTPSGRRATVKKLMTGASKHDPFDRIVCQYDDGGPKDLVTLQPQQLKRAPVKPKAPAREQLSFNLA